MGDGERKLKIALASDWHIGEYATSEKQIKNVVLAIANHSPDVLVLAGDFNGGTRGYSAVNRILTIVRQYLSDTPIIACNGNHDYWLRGSKKRFMDHYDPTEFKWHKPKMADWLENNQKIIESYRRFGVHFLDEDGVWRMDSKFPGYAIVGHTGWYDNLNPPTNDDRYMPVGIEGHTHGYMNKRAWERLGDHLGTLEPKDTNRIFVSHFPVVEINNSVDAVYSGSQSIGRIAQEVFGCKIFLNGHSHQRHEGPLRYECGRPTSKGKYGDPQYIIIEA